MKYSRVTFLFGNPPSAISKTPLSFPPPIGVEGKLQRESSYIFWIPAFVGMTKSKARTTRWGVYFLLISIFLFSRGLNASGNGVLHSDPSFSRSALRLPVAGSLSTVFSSAPSLRRPSGAARSSRAVDSEGSNGSRPSEHSAPVIVWGEGVSPPRTSMSRSNLMLPTPGRSAFTHHPSATESALGGQQRAPTRRPRHAACDSCLIPHIDTPRPEASVVPLTRCFLDQRRSTARTASIPCDDGSLLEDFCDDETTGTRAADVAAPPTTPAAVLPSECAAASPSTAPACGVGNQLPYDISDVESIDVREEGSGSS